MLYPRKILEMVKRVLNREEFVIITGARQTGKTSILFMLKEYLETKGALCHYLNLENPDYLKTLNSHPFNIFELLPDHKGKAYVFVDEIQYLDDPAKFLKLLYDEKRAEIKLIVSGSSAFYIDRKFKDSLAGRKFLFEAQTLDFNEFLVFNGVPDPAENKNKKLSAYNKDRISGLWKKYITFGGYPAVVLAENAELKKMLISEIGTSYIKKDIVDAGVRNTEKYFALLKILAAQTGGLVNSVELSNTLGIAHKTVEDYLYVIRKSYQAAFIKPFYANVRKELTKMPKVYFYDIGLRNFFLDNYNEMGKRADRGEYLENICFIEFLKKTGSADKVKFWRTQDKKEVDFVIGREAFEVKFDRNQFKGKKYAEFRKAYPEISFHMLGGGEIPRKFYGFNL